MLKFRHIPHGSMLHGPTMPLPMTPIGPKYVLISSLFSYSCCFCKNIVDLLFFVF